MRKQIILFAMLVLPAVACGGPGDDPDAVESTDVTDVREMDDAVQDSGELDACIPICESRARECGDDGCGGSCGICEVGECQDGSCWEDFGPCEDFECGEVDGEDCGACDDGWECQKNLCVHTACDQRQCGDDGFGGDCGECEDGYPCYENTCMYVDFPDCGNAECGMDSLGGWTCGDCDEGYVCVEMTGTCEIVCEFPDNYPTAWGPAGIVNHLHIPADSAEAGTCFDYTGDGVGESNLTYMASQLGPALEGMVDWNTFPVLEFVVVTDFLATADFRLNALYGSPVTAGTIGGETLVDQASWDVRTCRPYMTFANAAIADGVLTAESAAVAVFVNVSPSFALQVDLIDVSVTGAVAAGEDGVTVTEGSFSGILTSANYYAALERLQDECDKVPQPEDLAEICEYLSLAYSGVPRIVGPGYALLTLHRNDDGTYIPKDADHSGNAGAMCFKFQTAPAVITGYR